MGLPTRILSAKRPFRFQKDVRIDRIRINPLNPRRILREKDINKLCDSILEMGGILVPLVLLEVAPEDFVLIDGQRRLMAAQKLHMPAVPANIITGEMNDLENLCTMFSIHMARESWDPASRALALGKLKELYPEVSQERLEQITGMTKENISDADRILSFPKDIVDRCLLEGQKGYLRPANLVEMSKAIDVVTAYLPDFFKQHSREKFVRTLVDKRDTGVIPRNTDFRMIKTMIDTLPRGKAESLLDRLVKEPSTGISEIFESVEDLIATKRFTVFKRSCERYLEILRDFRFDKLDDKLGKEALTILARIKEEINKKVKLLEA